MDRKPKYCPEQITRRPPQIVTSCIECPNATKNDGGGYCENWFSCPVSGGGDIYDYRIERGEQGWPKKCFLKPYNPETDKIDVVCVGIHRGGVV